MTRRHRNSKAFSRHWEKARTLARKRARQLKQGVVRR